MLQFILQAAWSKARGSRDIALIGRVVHPEPTSVDKAGGLSFVARCFQRGHFFPHRLWCRQRNGWGQVAALGDSCVARLVGAARCGRMWHLWVGCGMQEDRFWFIRMMGRRAEGGRDKGHILHRGKPASRPNGSRVTSSGDSLPESRHSHRALSVSVDGSLLSANASFRFPSEGWSDACTNVRV